MVKQGSEHGFFLWAGHHTGKTFCYQSPLQKAPTATMLQKTPNSIRRIKWLHRLDLASMLDIRLLPEMLLLIIFIILSPRVPNIVHATNAP